MIPSAGALSHKAEMPLPTNTQYLNHMDQLFYWNTNFISHLLNYLKNILLFLV